MEEKHELNEFGETADQPEITGLMPDEKIKNLILKSKTKSKRLCRPKAFQTALPL